MISFTPLHRRRVTLSSGEEHLRQWRFGILHLSRFLCRITVSCQGHMKFGQLKFVTSMKVSMKVPVGFSRIFLDLVFDLTDIDLSFNVVRNRLSKQDSIE